jgi:hypothetical protein
LALPDPISVNPVISDPEYLKELKNGVTAGSQRAGPINIPLGSLPWSSGATATSPVSLVPSLLLLLHTYYCHFS